MKKSLTFIPSILFALLFVSFNTIGVFGQDSWKKTFKNKRGTLQIYYYNSPNFLSEEKGQLRGIEYDILLEFKRYVKKVYDTELTLDFVKAESFGGLYDQIKNGQTGQFGACSFSITEQRLKEVSFTPKYMPDIEVMISSSNLPIFKDTAEFLSYANSVEFLVVPNTTFEEDLERLDALNTGWKVTEVENSTILKEKINSGKNLIGYLELPNYLLSLKEGAKFKRQNLFKVERMGYGLIYPKNSDWGEVLDLFFREKEVIQRINEILHKYFGEDINDLVLKVEDSYQDEVLLLTKEKELQSLELKNEELLRNQQEIEYQMSTERAERERFILFIGIGCFAFVVVIVLIALRNKVKAKKIIEDQHLKLGKSYEEIADSIKYAERLQLAILPLKEDLRDNLGEGFVLFKPKNVVSGDFYWMQVVDGVTLYAVADCTGHGVPGAMVSVVCSNALNRAVKEFKLKRPAEILNKTRELVIETFSRSGQNVRDGMDIGLCAYYEDRLVFAGANNPLWIIRDSKWGQPEGFGHKLLKHDNRMVIEVKSNKQPVGLHERMNDFTETEIQLYPEDCVYLLTDGYADQFGGEKGKKFKYVTLKKLLASLFLEDMNQQKQVLEDTFEAWKGDLEQVDDVAIVGIRVN